MVHILTTLCGCEHNTTFNIENSEKTLLYLKIMNYYACSIAPRSNWQTIIFLQPMEMSSLLKIDIVFLSLLNQLINLEL